MKIAFFIALTLLPITVFAQKNTYYLGFEAGADRGLLENASDNSSHQIARTSEITPVFGLRTGYLNHRRNGFKGLCIAVQYIQIRQSTSGQNLNITFPVHGFTNSYLKYITVPIEAHFEAAGFQKFQPYLNLGIYGSYLLGYREVLHREYDVRGLYYQELNTTGTTMMEDAKDSYGGGGVNLIGINKGLYHDFDYGLTLAIGIKYAMNKHLVVGLKAGASYGIPDVERKEKLQYTTTITPYNRFVYDQYWKYETPKGVSDVTAGKERSPTHLFNSGLSVTLDYLFKN